MNPTRKEDLVDYDPVSGRVDSSPVQLYLEISSRCNLKCVHCSRDFGIEAGPPKLDLSAEAVRRMTPWLERARFINLNGVGEPLLAESFETLLDITAGHAGEVSFNTNGLLLDERRATRIVEAGVHSLALSFDGTHSMEAIRGVPFEVIRDRLVLLDTVKRRLGSEKPHVAIAFTAMRRNIMELPRLLSALLPIARVHSVHVQPAVIHYETLVRENIYRCEVVNQMLAEARAVADAHAVGITVFRSASDEDERHDSRNATLGQFSPTLGCIDPFYQLFIRATGDVVLCSHGRESGLNVLTMDPEDVWNHESLRQLRRALHARSPDAVCARCPLVFSNAENQQAPLRKGVHHSQAARFQAGGYGRRRPHTRLAKLPPFLGRVD